MNKDLSSLAPGDLAREVLALPDHELRSLPDRAGLAARLDGDNTDSDRIRARARLRGENQAATALSALGWTSGAAPAESEG